LEVIVEEKGAGGFAGLDGEGGEGLMFFVELEHAGEVDRADHIDVVEEEGLVHLSGIGAAGIGGGGILKKEPAGFLEAATGVEQDFFAGDFEAHAEIVVGFQVVGNHVRKVMDIDDDFGDAEGAQAGEGDFEQGATGNLDKGFGSSVGEGAEASAQAGGEDHRFHWGAFMSLSDNCKTNSSAAEAVKKRHDLFRH